MWYMNADDKVELTGGEKEKSWREGWESEKQQNWPYKCQNVFCPWQEKDWADMHPGMYLRVHM